MANYTSITDLVFAFSKHPTCINFSKALNNTYSEPLDAPVLTSLFTDAGRTAVVPDVVPVLRAAIINTIMLSSTADRTVVAPMINSMLLFLKVGNPPRKYPVRSTGTLTTALTAHVTSATPIVLLHVNPSTVFVDTDHFTIMDFGGLSLIRPVRPTANRTGAGTGAASYAAAITTTPAHIATAAANAHAAQ